MYYVREDQALTKADEELRLRADGIAVVQRANRMVGMAPRERAVAAAWDLLAITLTHAGGGLARERKPRKQGGLNVAAHSCGSPGPES
ncbi:hypothetical protein [Microtetraspora malaysiensis]|uniref:Uncharacterized protein n=1 Tax=Microtetraspora malaysiensis TaxID=161358 RepID=A0ABW6SVT8_9ACTN